MVHRGRSVTSELVKVLLDLLPCFARLFLDGANQLIDIAVERHDIVISEFIPLAPQSAIHLAPVSLECLLANHCSVSFVFDRMSIVYSTKVTQLRFVVALRESLLRWRWFRRWSHQFIDFLFRFAR